MRTASEADSPVTQIGPGTRSVPSYSSCSFAAQFRLIVTSA
jgi:hypothetical protein